MSLGPKITLTGSADKFLWIYLGIFGVIVMAIIYFLGRSVGKKQKGDEFKDDVVSNNLTYPKSQYVTFANQIESAMFRMGTDEDAIFNIFRKMMNIDDVKSLIAAFGSRRQELQLYSSTLEQWLANELSQSEITELNTILATKNINFSF